MNKITKQHIRTIVGNYRKIFKEIPTGKGIYFAELDKTEKRCLENYLTQ